MDHSESIYQFGANAYGKPTLALNILRDTIMGRELFDYAFKEYSKTWMFKHPTPTDFFRIMENASAVDLDWFWRGWFFSNDHVDLSIESVDWYQLEMDPEEQMVIKKESDTKSQYYSAMLDEEDIESTVTDRDPLTRDFYDNYDKDQVTRKGRGEAYKRQLEIYSWLLQKNGFDVSKVGYLMYYNGDTTQPHLGKTMQFRRTLVEFELDTDWIDNTVEGMFNCLQNDNAPKLDKEACEQCLYRETYQTL